MRALTALAALFVLSASAGSASATCKIGAVAELPVTMSGMRPLVPAKINGQEELFLADSGAFYSVISPSAASELHLKLMSAPDNFLVTGIGGAADAWLTRVKVFTLSGVPIPNVQFLVTGNISDTDEAGLIGQNVLGLADVEYDLAEGMIRLIRATGCSNTVLAYWRKPGAPFSMMPIDDASSTGPHTSGSVKVNGVKFRVTFDTGMSTSMLSLSAAARAGIRTSNAGVVEGGFVGGIGRGRVQTWVAPVDSLELGDSEKVLHTRLRIGSLSALDTDMLIGSDFFLSHRVYVANSQHRLYFTYNGGPVFNLEVAPQSAPETGPSPGPPPAAPAERAAWRALARRSRPGKTIPRRSPIFPRRSN
jgi:predicted aspartyl protease